ncbi:MAG: glycosyltransferase [Candidatus Fermentibacteraceae bacterium]
MTNPDISVQIPVRNGGSLFRNTLACLAAQDTRGFPWELVVADDGSDVPVEREFAAALAALPDNAGVRVVRLEGSGNRPVARNEAMKAGTAPVALLMDADLEFGPDLLCEHVKTRRAMGASFLMGARINAHSPDASAWQRWFDSRAMGNRPPGVFPWKYFITGNLSVDSGMLLGAGGFDPAIDRYGGEDVEAGLRLWKAGAIFHWTPEIIVRHMDSVTPRKHSEKMVEYGATGLKYTLAKHPEAAGLLGSLWVEPLFRPPLTPGLVLMRFFCMLALRPWFYRAVLSFMEKRSAPRSGFTYLSVGACLMGLSGRDFRT